MAIVRSRQYRFWWMLLAAILAILTLLLLHPGSPPPDRPSSYEIAIREPFNQPDFYPVQQTGDGGLYTPVGDWVGRLLLPSSQEYEIGSTDGSLSSDWAWLQVYSAPPEWQQWVGTVVRLEWQDLPEGQRLLPILRSDIHFRKDAWEANRVGDVVPQRLDGRSRVGPLQSLAGARPLDDVIVALKAGNVIVNTESTPALQVKQFPLQVPERFYGLVKILGGAEPASDFSAVKGCSHESGCAKEFLRVQHFNSQSQQFDGPIEIVRFPQQPADRNGRWPSTPSQLETSPAGSEGWYIYGARTADGMFVVRALQPRSLFQLHSDRSIRGLRAGFRYISGQNWKNTEALKGTTQTALIRTDGRTDVAENPWQEGDRALVIHLFGGIGGEKGEPTLAGTVTGHFAYGTATVVREPLAGELQLAIDYEQVYAHNPNGIVAGSASWANYMGDLQRGWLGTRPVSDVVVKLEAITQDYDFGGDRLSPLEELQRQLQVMAARYRTGDGTGVAIVTPSTSCVQDSNQALYIAIESLKLQVLSNPNIQHWLEEHPTHPQTLRFQTLIDLERDLVKALAPFGSVRQDWQHNAERLEGIGNGQGFIRNPTLQAGWESLVTMLPRRAHDELSHIFLEHGATLWFVRTNQVGGTDPTIVPLAPTIVFGQFPIVSTLLRRTVIAAATGPAPLEWLAAAGILGLYAAIALPVGFRTGLFRFERVAEPRGARALGLLGTFFSPALLEELIFRVAIVPHTVERVSEWTWLAEAIASTALFVLYHPLLAATVYPQSKSTFFRPAFLWLAGLLGVACLLAYRFTSSIWPAVAIHWIVVVVWLYWLGGQAVLSGGRSKSRQS